MSLKLSPACLWPVKYSATLRPWGRTATKPDVLIALAWGVLPAASSLVRSALSERICAVVSSR